MTDKASYYKLFSAYLLALLGTGVAVVALSLLAYELAGEADAPAVIGAALSIKTLAYVLGAPLAAALTARAARRPLMIGLDLLRAGALLALPFASEIWQLYALIALFSLASAAFTPAYQASVPLLLPEPGDYAQSLARSRIAQEVEGAISPLVAAALLIALSPRGLLIATMAAFLLSALLVARARLPRGAREGAAVGPVAGFRILLSAPALAGLAPLALGVGAATAMITVNTAPLVLGKFGLEGRWAAAALAAFGLGAVIGALMLPRLMAERGERALMLAGGATMAGALALSAGVSLYGSLLALWAVAGFGAAMAQAPAAALIRRAAPADSRQSVYAANLALGALASGAGYAAAGALDVAVSMQVASLVFAGVATVATLVAALVWPAPGTLRAGAA
ncbi:MAG: MFS transporter [Rubrimonas sp.]|uniref:MFS transporter n=1 Tax=Rubrimonas sp. TaxID=2036015 RepID=UPI002FDED4E4